MNDDGFKHLIPLVQALIAAGNPPAQHNGPGLFRQGQGGAYCVLEGRLRFEAVRHMPRRAEVVLNEANDYIACSHCWATIRGGKYLATRG